MGRHGVFIFKLGTLNRSRSCLCLRAGLRSILTDSGYEYFFHLPSMIRRSLKKKHLPLKSFRWRSAQHTPSRKMGESEPPW